MLGVYFSRLLFYKFLSSVENGYVKRESLILLFPHKVNLVSTLHIGLIYIHTRRTHNTVRQ